MLAAREEGFFSVLENRPPRRAIARKRRGRCLSGGSRRKGFLYYSPNSSLHTCLAATTRSLVLHTPALVGRKEQRKKKRKGHLGKVKMSASEGDRREKLHFAASSSSAVAPANYEVSFKLTALLLSGPVFLPSDEGKGRSKRYAGLLGVGVALLQRALSHSAAFWEQSGI